MYTTPTDTFLSHLNLFCSSTWWLKVRPSVAGREKQKEDTGYRREDYTDTGDELLVEKMENCTVTMFTLFLNQSFPILSLIQPLLP
jgi:hypothetical protein